MITRDGGATWEDRKPGAQDDAHAIAIHPEAPERVYEAAGGGVAYSHDAGRTWSSADEGMDRHYAWGLTIDAADPDLWYVSASFGSQHRVAAQQVVVVEIFIAERQPLHALCDQTLQRVFNILPQQRFDDGFFRSTAPSMPGFVSTTD
jgi:hypothetical protein